MARSARIALLGLSSTEAAAFEAFLRGAAKRRPAYAQEADPRAADFIIVDAADSQLIDHLRKNRLLRRAVVLGEPACEGAMWQLRRPIKLDDVVRALDDLVSGPDTEDMPASGMRVTEMQLEVYAATPPRGVQAAAGEGWRRKHRRSRKPRELATTISDGFHAEPDTAPTPSFGAAAQAPAAPPQEEADHGGRVVRGGARMDHILVVDDSEIALRFMTSHLQRFGFQIHLAQSGDEALERVAKRHFEFVFLDVMMEGLDGFQTCKAIKRAAHHPGHRPPTVVMLTCRGSAADRLRGTMAGADAYLTKPLREVELLKIMGEREVTRHAFVDTPATSTRS
jgi:CheY-like chemotaxis protein